MKLIVLYCVAKFVDVSRGKFLEGKKNKHRKQAIK